MSDEEFLLERIEEALVEHGGDLGGWTKRDGETLQVFDGRVRLRVEFAEAGPSGDEGMVHAHLLASLPEYDDEVLDACLFGMGNDRESALDQAALIWLTGVAGPIKSFLDGKPVCMTCQAGVQGGDISEGYAEGDYGLAGLRAYVGPATARGFENEEIHSSIDDTKPWFRYAAESAAPRRIHLAKATVISEGENGWRRELEIDGHDVSHQDSDWPADARGPAFGYLLRFAVFEFPQNSNEIKTRAELERTIRHFAKNFSKHESIADLMDQMVRKGFDAELVHEAESISTIAFGRMFFESHGVQYSPTVIRARSDGRIQTDVPLMSIPAYNRARAIAGKMAESLSDDEFQALCFYNAESQAILQALELMGEDLDLSGMTMYPCVVPDRETSSETMHKALELINQMIEKRRSDNKKKPWWRFW